MDEDVIEHGGSPRGAFVLSMITVRLGADRFVGQLEIVPGAITFTPSPRVNSWLTANTVEPMIHTAPTVFAVRARLRPPNLSWSIELRVRRQPRGLCNARVDMAAWHRRPVTAALISAGFDVVEESTWFSLTHDTC